jgi:hypothetical protein
VETHCTTPEAAAVLDDLLRAETALDHAWSACADWMLRDDRKLTAAGLKVAAAGESTCDAARALRQLVNLAATGDVDRNGDLRSVA